MAGLDFALRGLLEIEDVQRLGWTGDDIAALGQRAALEERGSTAYGGHVRTGEEELEKLAAGRRRSVVHDALPNGTSYNVDASSAREADLR